MIRKLLAAGVAAGLGALVLPALPAAASANSTARITSASDVFPGAHTYSIQVNNTEAGVPQVGSGTAINAMRIELPTAAAGLVQGTTAPTCGAFTGKWIVVGGTHIADFRGSTLPAGTNLTCALPVNVLQPTRTDLTGTFRVLVSSDNFATNRASTATAAGALTTAVRILEIVGGTLRPTAPTNATNTKGVTDRSGTSGQTVTYAFGVKNYAKQAVSVTPALTVNSAAETPGTGTAATVAPGDSPTELTVPLTLGSVASGSERSVTVTAAATAPGAVAGTKNDAFRVQGPVTLGATNLRPTRTRSGELSARDFTLDLAKTGVQGASVTGSTLSFGSNSADASGLPLTYANGGSTKNVKYSFGDISGDGSIAVKLVNAGEDDNLAPLGNSLLDLGAITIDNLKPAVSINALLGNDADGDTRVAATNGHSITVNGTITGQNTGAAGSNDLDLATLKVKIAPDAGPERAITVTTTKNSDGSVSFTGSMQTAWDPSATNFTAVAEITDEATNRGFATTQAYPVDLKAPDLDNPGVVVNSKVIEIKFADLNSIRGGCDPEAFDIDGVPGRVKSVTDGTGTVLADGNCNPTTVTNGKRILTMIDSYSIDAVQTPNVTYNQLARPLGFRPAKDGSGQDVLTKIIQTVSNVVPIAPTLVQVERKNMNGAGNEPAYYDTDTKSYYTNATGAADNTITVAGVRNGYTLAVRDASGNTLNTAGPFVVANEPVTNNPRSTEGSITVPLGTANVDYQRFLVLISSRGFESPALPVTLTVDTVVPGLGATTWNNVDTASQKFNDKIVAGSDVSDNFYARYTVQGDGGSQTAYGTSQSVTTVDSTTRSIKFTLDDPASFQGVEYVHFSGTRYEDRAGNLMTDTLTP